MFRPYHNGHLQASILGGVVNTIVIRNIRDLVSCATLAVYYHILVGGVVVKQLVVLFYDTKSSKLPVLQLS
jgi:hypothetical protein